MERKWTVLGLQQSPGFGSGGSFLSRTASGFYILAMKADGFEALAFLAISFYFWISKLIVPTTKE